uniref:Uncharacterized protein n=1 Tax=Sphaerodactylus townsendi TaxID=933632 RepID=A0ACB8G7D5_9SAUR
MGGCSTDMLRGTWAQDESATGSSCCAPPLPELFLNPAITQMPPHCKAPSLHTRGSEPWVSDLNRCSSSKILTDGRKYGHLITRGLCCRQPLANHPIYIFPEQAGLRLFKLRKGEPRPGEQKELGSRGDAWRQAVTPSPNSLGDRPAPKGFKRFF